MKYPECNSLETIKNIIKYYVNKIKGNTICILFYFDAAKMLFTNNMLATMIIAV